MSDTCKPCETGFPEPVQPYGPMPFTPPVPDTACGYSVIQSVNDCIQRLNNNAETYNEVIKECYSTLRNLERIAKNDGVFYDTDSVTQIGGYNAFLRTNYSYTRIKPCDINGRKINIKLALAYDNTNNLNITQSINSASINKYANDIIPAIMPEVTTGWYGKVFYEGAPIVTSEIDYYYTIGFTENNQFKVYSNDTDNSVLCNDKIRYSMGVQAIVIQNGALANDEEFNNITNYNQNLARTLIGQNENTGETYFMFLPSSPGVTSKEAAELFLRNCGVTVAAETANGNYAADLTHGYNVLTTPYTVNTLAYWYISKTDQYTTLYDYELAEAVQLIAQYNNDFDTIEGLQNEINVIKETYMPKAGGSFNDNSSVTFPASGGKTTIFGNQETVQKDNANTVKVVNCSGMALNNNGQQVGITGCSGLSGQSNIDLESGNNGAVSISNTVEDTTYKIKIANNTITPMENDSNAPLYISTPQIDVNGAEIIGVNTLIGHNANITIKPSQGTTSYISMDGNEVIIKPNNPDIGVRLGGNTDSPAQLTNVKDPINATDAATKSYVDTEIGKLPQLPENWITRDGGTFNVGATLNFPLNEQGYNTTVGPNNIYVAGTSGFSKLTSTSLLVDASSTMNKKTILDGTALTIYNAETLTDLTQYASNGVYCVQNSPFYIGANKVEFRTATENNPIVVTGIANPSEDNDAANKAYVDNASSAKWRNYGISSSEISSDGLVLSDIKGGALFELNNRAFIYITATFSKSPGRNYANLIISSPTLNLPLQNIVNYIQDSVGNTYTIDGLSNTTTFLVNSSYTSTLYAYYNDSSSGIYIQILFDDNSASLNSGNITFKVELLPNPAT